MMYFKAARMYNSSDWNYLEIPDEVFVSRYDCVAINLPSDKERIRWSQEKYPWAHTKNIKRLFLLCRTFSSKKQVIEWITENLQGLIMPEHLSLIETFCFSENNITVSLDELIEKSNEKELLSFIQIVLDRCLLWYDSDPTYRSAFENILWDADKELEKGIRLPLKWINNPEIDGVYWASAPEYTHVFYKYQNLVKGMVKGELYFEIRNLSKQAHLALLKSISVFYEYSYNLTFFNEENWERKLNDIFNRETEWCKVQIQKS